jgi:hypothetical protein
MGVYRAVHWWQPDTTTLTKVKRMSKIKSLLIGLVLTTMLDLVAFVYAYSQPPERAGGFGPGDHYLFAVNVQPTSNATEWSKDNFTFVGAYEGELTEPLDEYVKFAVESQCYVRLPDGYIVDIKNGVYWFRNAFY